MNKALLGLAILTAALLAPGQAFSQDGYQLEGITFSSGASPVTGGVSGTIRLSRDDGRFFEVSAQSDAAWFVYGKYFSRDNITFTVAGSVGHVQTGPWAGPLLDADVKLSEKVSVGAMYWPGFFSEEPDDWKTKVDGVKNPESILSGQFGGVRLNLGPVQLSYYMLNFLDEPWNELPGATYTIDFGGGVKVPLSATWNNNDEDWMFLVGITWVLGG